MNLVEELRKVSNPSNHGCFLCDAAERVGVNDNGGCDTCMNTLFKIADLIEKYYYPKPLFEDGEPVNLGDEFVSNDGKTCPVTSIGVAEDYFVVNPCACNEEDQFGYWEYESVRVKRPEPKVFDADGVLIKVGDMVWYTLSKQPLFVNRIFPSGSLDLTYEMGGWGGHGCVSPDKVTHRKPDTQETIEEDSYLEAAVYCRNRGLYYKRPSTNDNASNDGTAWGMMVRDLLRRQRELDGKQ